jgi:hypothetical protein
LQTPMSVLPPQQFCAAAFPASQSFVFPWPIWHMAPAAAPHPQKPESDDPFPQDP